MIPDEFYLEMIFMKLIKFIEARYLLRFLVIS